MTWRGATDRCSRGASTHAIRLDTTIAVHDSATWRGLRSRPWCFPGAAMRIGTIAAGVAERDSATARLLAGPLLAATAAEAWLRRA